MQTSSNILKLLLSSAFTSALVVGLGSLLLPWLLRTAADPAADALRGVPVSPADALLACAATLAAGCLGWLLLGVALEVLAHAPGGVGRAAARVSAAVTPRLLRRGVGLALGLGVGVGLGAGPTLAAPTRAVSAAAQASVRDVVLAAGGASPSSTTHARRLPDPGWTEPDPGWTPDPPLVRPQPDVSAVSPAGRRPSPVPVAEVVVRRGDSLWAVAARHLGPGATDAEVAAEWPRWYAANRAVIGPDPDLVLPGQVLRAPGDPR